MVGRTTKWKIHQYWFFVLCPRAWQPVNKINRHSFFIKLILHNISIRLPAGGFVLYLLLQFSTDMLSRARVTHSLATSGPFSALLVFILDPDLGLSWTQGILPVCHPTELRQYHQESPHSQGYQSSVPGVHRKDRECTIHLTKRAYHLAFFW
jgi:hypothetical protein